MKRKPRKKKTPKVAAYLDKKAKTSAKKVSKEADQAKKRALEEYELKLKCARLEKKVRTEQSYSGPLTTPTPTIPTRDWKNKYAVEVGMYVRVEEDLSPRMNSPGGNAWVTSVSGVGGATLTTVKYDNVSALQHKKISL